MQVLDCTSIHTHTQAHALMDPSIYVTSSDNDEIRNERVDYVYRFNTALACKLDMYTSDSLWELVAL